VSCSNLETSKIPLTSYGISMARQHLAQGKPFMELRDLLD